MAAGVSAGADVSVTATSEPLVVPTTVSIADAASRVSLFTWEEIATQEITTLGSRTPSWASESGAVSTTLPGSTELTRTQETSTAENARFSHAGVSTGADVSA